MAEVLRKYFLLAKQHSVAPPELEREYHIVVGDRPDGNPHCIMPSPAHKLRPARTPGHLSSMGGVAASTTPVAAPLLQSLFSEATTPNQGAAASTSGLVLFRYFAGLVGVVVQRVVGRGRAQKMSSC